MLALKLLLRNWRSGELRLLTLALLVAVTVVSGISIFVDRLERSLELQTAELLGADLVVISPSPHPETWIQEANRRGILHTDFIRLQTMAYAGEETALISLHAVEQGYPLRGEVALADKFDPNQLTLITGNATKQIPKAGEVWVAPELLLQLDLQLGQQIEVGNAAFTITKVLTDSPEPFTRYPIVIMNHRDIESTGVILPGSFVRYRWLLAADDVAKLDDFKLWLEPQLDPQQEITDAHSRSEWLQRTVERSANLLSLSAVISVLLAGVAISIATRQFVERHVNQVAVKKSFGATSQQIKQLYFGQLLFLGVIASGAGVGLGHFMQHGIAQYMLQFFAVELAPSHMLPYLYSLLSGIVFLVFFALPPLWHLPNIPPLRVLRRDLQLNAAKTWVQATFACCALFGLIAVFSKNLELTLKVCLALIVVAALTLILARFTIWLSKKWSVRSRGFWRLGLVNLQRRYQHNTMLIAVFSTTLMALLVLALMRDAFWQDIQEYGMSEEVNFYMMNISQEQKSLVQDFLEPLDIEHGMLSPFVAGRLTGVNGKEPDEEHSDYWIYNREIWMTWKQELPEEQVLLSGSWWPDLDPRQEEVLLLSLRQDIAENGGLKIGDQLTFLFAGQQRLAEVTSIRQESEGAEFNFAFVFEPKYIQHFHHTYIMALDVPPEHKAAVYRFGREHPTIVMESFEAWLAKTKKILQQALDGALLVLLLTLFCGCLVLFAAVNSSIASRKQETGLLRAFGSGQRLILGSIWLEFVLVGLVSGVIAVVASEILIYQLQNMFSEVPFIFHYQYWLPVVAGSALFIGLLGAVACRSVVTTPPNVVLTDS